MNADDTDNADICGFNYYYVYVIC